MRRLRCGLAGGALLAACLAWGIAAAGRSAPGPVSPRPRYCPPPDTLAAHVAAMSRRAEQLLGGSFQRPVTAVCLAPDSARARLHRPITDEIDQARQSGRLAVYSQLALRPATLSDSVWVPLAWYEPGRDSVWVVADTNLASGGLDELLVHELVHALHDQTYGLRGFMRSRGDTATWDQEQARRSMVEGQATWAELQFYLACHHRTLDPGDLSIYYWALERISLREAAEAQARRERARRAKGIRGPARAGEISMLAWLPFYWYEMGLVFTDNAVAAGGVPLLTEVMRAPPVSMKQVLHPGRFLGNPTRPRRFRPGPADGIWPGAAELNRDTYGPLMLRLYLEMHGQGKQAGFLTRGWDGDLLLLLRRGDEPPVLLWWTAWDAPWDAVGFAEGYRATLRARGVRKSLGPDLWRGSDPDRRWSVLRDDCRVLIIENAPAADLAALRAAMSAVPAEAAPADTAAVVDPSSSP